MVTLDIPKELNKEIEHIKIEKELKDKRDAILMLLRQSVTGVKDNSIEEVFCEADKLKPLKISIKELKRMKEEIYCR